VTPDSMCSFTQQAMAQLFTLSHGSQTRSSVARQSNVVKSTSTRLDVAARSVLHAIQSLHMLVQYCVVYMT
jgi:hypothetical protein